MATTVSTLIVLFIVVSVLVSYCDVPAADYFLSLSPKASLMVVRIVATTVRTFRMSAIIFKF